MQRPGGRSLSECCRLCCRRGAGRARRCACAGVCVHVCSCALVHAWSWLAPRALWKEPVQAWGQQCLVLGLTGPLGDVGPRERRLSQSQVQEKGAVFPHSSRALRAVGIRAAVMCQRDTDPGSAPNSSGKLGGSKSASFLWNLLLYLRWGLSVLGVEIAPLLNSGPFPASVI